MFVRRIRQTQHYRVCRVRCKLCGSVIEWRNKSKSDGGPGRVLYCQCGMVGMAPSAYCHQIVLVVPATLDDVEDLFEKWED